MTSCGLGTSVPPLARCSKTQKSQGTDLARFPVVHSGRENKAHTLSAFSAALLRGESLKARVRGATVRAFRDAECAMATWVCEVDGLVHTSGDPFDVAVAFVTAREDLSRATLPAPRPKFPALRDVPTQPLPLVPLSTTPDECS